MWLPVPSTLTIPFVHLAALFSILSSVSFDNIFILFPLKRFLVYVHLIIPLYHRKVTFFWRRTKSLLRLPLRKGICTILCVHREATWIGVQIELKSFRKIKK